MEHADIKNYRTLYIDSKDSQELLHIVDSLDLLLPNLMDPPDLVKHLALDLISKWD